MIKSQQLYINIDSTNQATALVRGTFNTSPATIGTVIAGDTLRYVVTLLDSTGATSSLSGDPNIKLQMAIGTFQGSYVTSSNFVVTGSSWSGSLNTNTGSLLNALGTADTLSTYLEAQLLVTGSTAPDTGSIYTILQAPLTVRNQVIT